MLELELDIRSRAPYGRLLSGDALRLVVAKTLEVAGVDGTVQIGLVVAGDRKMRALNKQYRGIDETTDVLSFALEEQAGDEGFILPPGDVKRLGDIIISYPRAARQAEEQKHGVDQEITFLVIHGVLHLLGYDHLKPDDRKRMKAREKKAIAAIETPVQQS